MRGEPDLRTPAHIAEAAAKALAAGRTMYPDNRGEPALRAAVAEKLRRENGLEYDPATEILVTTGGTFGIYAALAAMLNPGDAVLVPDPVYDAYLSPVRLTGATPVPVATSIVDGRFVLTAEALEAAWNPACRALLLNTPWNPTGTVLTREELAAIADFCDRRNITIISDEIYEAIVYEGHRHISPATLLRDRTVVVNALSKTYAMTGWRVGYVAAPVEFVRAMFLVLQQSSRGPATFVQDAAAAALSGPQECVAQMQAEYARRRALVLDALAPHVLAPEGGFFAMLDLRHTGVPSNEIRKRLLAEHGVVVVHGAAYGPAGEGTLRVSFASGGDVLHRGLEKLRAGLQAICG
jgi:aspartate/methionine/tyrosine aminotransferase